MGLAAAEPFHPFTPVPSHNRAYVSFGAGEHQCPARDIALKIDEVAIEASIRHLGRMRLAVPADPTAASGGIGVHAWPGTPAVVFTPNTPM